MTSDRIDRMLTAIETEGSCVELRMQSFPGGQDGHQQMVNELRDAARLRLKGQRLQRVLEALNRLGCK
jgi:hypothetical protein